LSGSKALREKARKDLIQKHLKKGREEGKARLYRYAYNQHVASFSNEEMYIKEI
jgi:hypothetical protein